MNPGEKIILKTVMQTQRIIVGGDTYEEVVEVGTVMRAMPGPPEKTHSRSLPWGSTTVSHGLSLSRDICRALRA